MKLKWIVFVCGIFIFQSACSTQTPLPPTSSVSTVTLAAKTPTHTPKPIPTVVQTPSKTPTPTLLSPEEVDKLSPGSYWVLTYYMRDHILLRFIRIDGREIKSFQIPLDNRNSYADSLGVSPDGKYFAYYTGSFGENISLRIDEFNIQEPFGLTLNIYSLESNHLLISIPLLSDNFPENFMELADTEYARSIPYWGGSPTEYRAGVFYGAFVAGIYSHAWSEDSAYLAFAGQIDGPTSDVYIYEIESNQYRRITSGLEQIQYIDWSPDGKWIVHGRSYTYGVNTPLTHHIASRDGNKVISYPSDLGEFVDGWINPTTFVAYENENIYCEHDITVFNTVTGEARTIWPYSFNSFAYDPSTFNFLINLSEQNIPSDETGLFFLSNAGYVVEKIAESGSGVYINHPDYSFFAYVEGSPALITKSGGIESIDAEIIGRPIPSPDGRMIAFNQNQIPGMDLYTIETGELKSITDLPAGQIYWSPDSRYLAFYDWDAETGVSIYSVETGDVHTIGLFDSIGADWAPDSRGLLYFGGGNIYFSSPDGSDQILVGPVYEYFYSRYNVIRPRDRFVEVE